MTWDVCGAMGAENDFEAAANRIEEIVKHWPAQQEGVQAQFKQLMWRFSIHNPENVRMWLELIGAKASA